MAKGNPVATAYVDVKPKLDGGFKATIEKEIPDGGKPGKEYGGKFSNAAKSAISAGAVALGNILSNAVQGAASGIADTMKQAFYGFADYEQLTGGVEKLFGEDAADIVKRNAENAFKSAGLSANEYMEQATSFSASLISSLEGDTLTAANLADVAMRNMSDNANTFGTDMASIQNAYQGFAKQNFTMLDNLKLGYGGTKEEMDRLLADAERLEGFEPGSMSVDNFADIIEAIDIVQEHMQISGLTAEQAAEMVAVGALTEEEALKRMGTTAREGATTVQGSLNTARAAWDNWVAALGRDDVDMTAMTDSLVQAVGQAAANAIPVVGRIMENIGYTLAAYAPVLYENALIAMSQIAAAAPDATPQLLAGLVSMILQGALVLVNSAPALVSGATHMVGGIVHGIVNAIPTVLATVVGMIPQIAVSVASGAGQLLGAALELFGSLVNALVDIGNTLADMVVYVVTHLPEIVMGGIDLMFQAGESFLGGLIDGFTGKQPEAEAAVTQTTDAMAETATANADMTAVSGQMASSLTDGFDLTQFQAKVERDTKAAVDSAAVAADAAPVSDVLGTTAAQGIDVTAMNAQASEMVENAIAAAKAVDASGIGSEFSEKAAGGMDVSAMASKLTEATAGMAQTATVSVQADLSGVNALKSAAGTVQSAYATMANSVSSAMSRAASSASSAASQIRARLASLPKTTGVKVNVVKGSVQLPHFSMSGNFDPKTKAVPTVNVSWWKQGGIFTEPTIFANGVGEAGPEAVLPLDRLSELLDESNGKYAGDTTNIYVDGIQASPESELYRLLAAVVEESKVAERRKAVHRR